MIEVAYQALAGQIATRLIEARFIASVGDLKIDPEGLFEPTGQEEHLNTAASLMKVSTRSVRQLLGGPAPRHIVERECRLELAIAGPDRLRKTARIDDALTGLALIPRDFPTLSGAAERLSLGDQTDDELPPNGVTFTLTFTIRVRSGDPLGRTP